MNITGEEVQKEIVLVTEDEEEQDNKDNIGNPEQTLEATNPAEAQQVITSSSLCELSIANILTSFANLFSFKFQVKLWKKNK